MSDITDIYINAWKEVMGEPANRLYCSWHVDQAWRRNLPKITTKDRQAEAYKMLRTLMEERDEQAFALMLESTIENLTQENSTLEFGKYFKSTYSSCYKSWAYCFRKNLGLNTNMHVERMHKTLKYYIWGIS